MYRTNTCGELRATDISKEVTLCGWVQKVRNLGAMIFFDLRDRYGITQVAIDQNSSSQLKALGESLGREFVVQVKGLVIERASKNAKIPTGDIELQASEIVILSKSETPPFTIEEHSDGGDELRMQYRYLDLRRSPLQHNMILRHKMAQSLRRYLDSQNFLEIETPYLIKSTPEGARDFVVPSRMNTGTFYALPQSPQTFKQLLMVSGYDRYFQIVRCFRDEDLRADRQPEFTQIDCEMSFVERDDVLSTFEGMIKAMFSETIGYDMVGEIPRLSYADAIAYYGSDKPDLRFDMKMHEFSSDMRGEGFVVFDNAEYVGGICAKGAASYTRKQLDGLTNWVKRPQIGATGLIYARVEADGNVKSSVDKFFDQPTLQLWASELGAEAGDLILVMAGGKRKTQTALGELRLHVARELGLIILGVYAPLWVVDFPLLEWDEESGRYFAMHHPFTAPAIEDLDKFMTSDDLREIRANAYDFVCNGAEIGGGSIRIHDGEVQSRMFEVLGFTPEEAEEQFGFLLGAFKYGAPPHGGIAFGFDRWCAIFGGSESIRDYIAFPKNNSGRDTMIESPAPISAEQLKELELSLNSQDK
ncbi:MAG: aspartate--tRNA ligase [Rikenellaceae bacterium]